MPDDVRYRHMHSCSAFSLAAATGLPRETIRRKITRLIELGWVEKTGRADVRITPKVSEHFTPDFNMRLLDKFLQTADRIRGVLAGASSPQSVAELARWTRLEPPTPDSRRDPHLSPHLRQTHGNRHLGSGAVHPTQAGGGDSATFHQHPPCPPRHRGRHGWH